MEDVSLPATWTSGRSTASLFAYIGFLSGQTLSLRQLDLVRWELEKYGPALHEDPPDVLLTEALEFTTKQLTGEHDPREFVRFHGSQILRRRGRLLLDQATSACIRLAAFGESGVNPIIEAVLHDMTLNAQGTMAVEDGERRYQLGDDDLREMEETRKLPEQPDVAEMTMRLRGAVGLLSRPPAWTEGNAMAFALWMAHVADRMDAGAPPSMIKTMLSNPAYAPAAPEDLLVGGLALYEACSGNRWLLLRALEDQLMHFVHYELDRRELILQFVNHLAAEHVTPFRRAIVTTTMAVLAVSPNAQQRPRLCPPWPV